MKADTSIDLKQTRREALPPQGFTPPCGGALLERRRGECSPCPRLLREQGVFRLDWSPIFPRWHYSAFVLDIEHKMGTRHTHIWQSINTSTKTKTAKKRTHAFSDGDTK
jgi:hypothetical protein